jgi:tryptophan halogenase
VESTQLRSIAIVGGGSAGWTAAAVLSRLLKPSHCRIMLIERPQPTPLGVGEGTIPAFQRLNKLLGIDETDYVRKTDATFKLGIEFKDWWRTGKSYFHTFCAFGGDIASVGFHHYWRKLAALGDDQPIDAYSIGTAAAKLGRFQLPVANPQSVLSLFSHAYHVDSALHARYLRDFAKARGVEAIDQTVVSAELRQADGFLECIVLDDGRRITADFFIDCSGFPGILLEDALKTGYEDWGCWLPCDRAVSVVCDASDECPPFTRSIARDAGWQWSLPLGSRMDHGYLYSSRFTDDDRATRDFIQTLDARPAGPPQFARFTTGRPQLFWNKNCLVLPGGFLEPLEATHMHMVQTSILKLFGMFPDRSFNHADSDEYNRLTSIEYDRVRDFLILHYCLTDRSDTPLWNWCREMPIPETLRDKIDLFRASGHVAMLDNEHFGEQSWLSVFLGHNIIPARHDLLADVFDAAEVRRRLDGMRTMIGDAARAMPSHRVFLSQLRRAERVAAS